MQANGKKILVDCGLYQERQFRARNWEPFPVSPGSIDAVLVTHAHLDHCGLLPKLVREGFKGKIYCTFASADIAQIVLLDAGHLQEEDAEFKRKRHKREGRKGAYPEVPLYTVEDAKACEPLFSRVKYRQQVEIGDGNIVRPYLEYRYPPCRLPNNTIISSPEHGNSRGIYEQTIGYDILGGRRRDEQGQTGGLRGINRVLQCNCVVGYSVADGSICSCVDPPRCCLCFA